MSIELRCESCGKLLKAPSTAVGKRKKCPSCGHELYIPTPEGEIDELPLAPEDDAERIREEALQAERRRIDRAIAHEDEDATPPGDGPSHHGTSRRTSTSIERMVIAFLLAMRDSDLSRADQLLPELRRRRSEALEIVDRLVADQIPPPQLVNVPPAVYQGVLKKLRSQV